MMHRNSLERFADSYVQLRCRLVSFASRFVDRSTAEDLVQDAFVRAMIADTAQGDSPSAAYFMAAVRNLAKQIYAKRSRVAAMQAEQRCVDEMRDTGLERCEASEDPLWREMSRLSHNQWSAMVLTTVVGMSERHAANLMGSSRSSVAGTRERAIRSLRRSLTESPEVVVTAGRRRRHNAA